MVLFNVLSAKQTLLSPEIAIGGMFIALNEQQSRRRDTLRMNELTGGGDGFIFATLDTILRYVFQDSAPF
ncbi:hypothetical protein PROH_08050 [Prochlorothrix hollandica PCC 9006 = CALU 1027]|uniref:Uncharacterized protein n=1 Tax=Prochlorothrix hollandica PCC 9006 = CALU 1027 TaxID=317619 RepID=A0A0M2PUK4_PROHO|nr:hypothetical protein PROH_08050 [Prochlorothrix hollandica PCC 9006 = CALU 1027]